MVRDPTDRRFRARSARRQAMLDAGQRLMIHESLEALTMQRVADEVDCAVGTIYGYFPSKGALIAAVQTAALDRLAVAYREFRAAADAHLAGAPEDVAAMARVLAFERFWIEAIDTHPEETRLLELLMAAQNELMSNDERMGVVPSALRLLNEAEGALGAAATLGVLAPGDAFERVVTWAAAINGVLQTSGLAPVDAEIFDGPRLAQRLTRDLFAGWGAKRSVLAEADRLLNRFPGAFAPPGDEA